MRGLRARCRDYAVSTRGTLVSVGEQPGSCPSCDGPMLVRKTVQRCGVTLTHGAFEAKETVHVCKAGCRFANGLAVTRRAQELAQCIPPRKVVGYDLMVYVGLQRYLQHRQREEIRAVLEDEHGIALSSGEISVLARRFLEHLQALHEARTPALRAALAADGGWPLHVDATGESGRGTVLVAFTSWRGWVLGAWKIPTERTDAILPRLREVVTRFGDPCAVMRDLGKAMIPAVKGLVDTPPKDGARVIALSCHLHFLSDVGNDLLDPAHAKLRAFFRTSKVRPRLRALARDLGRELGNDLQQGRDALKNWRDDEEALHRVPDGRDGLAVVRGLAQWVLDYAADASYGSGLPFDRPYLDLYDRCRTARRAVHAFSRRPPGDPRVRRTLARLLRIVDAVAAAEQTPLKIAVTLRKRASLFDELREMLRLGGTSAPTAPTPSKEALAELQDIRANFDRWVDGLRERRPERGPAEDTREAIDVVLDHVDRHGASLWGHAMALPAEAGGGFRLVDRTNNCEENLFHEVKHGERRRSGRKVLTHDFETLPAAAFLVQNLKRDDYVAILCNTLDDLPAAFAAMDAQRASDQRNRPAPDKASAQPALQPVASASLPTTDRRIVRTEAMDRRVSRAARSRAPQVAVGAR